MNHPVLTSIAAIDAALDEVADVSPVHMSVTEKQAALTRLARTRSRVEAIELRLLAASDDIAVATGARSTAAWVADRTRQAHGTLRRHATLAAALDTRWVHTADGLAAGTINLAQAGVIVDALDALPPDLDDALRTKAETYLLDHAANRLRTYLNAYTSPRRHHLDPTVEPGAEPGAEDEAQRRPIERRRHHRDHHTGPPEPPGRPGHRHHLHRRQDHRRPGPPPGLSGRHPPRRPRRPSEIIDVGRTRRLVTDSIRRALNLRDQGCTAAGCTMPADFCEAHHVTP